MPPWAPLPFPTPSSGMFQKTNTFPLPIYPVPSLFIPQLRTENAALTRAAGAAPAMALPVCARRARLTSDFSRRIKLRYAEPTSLVSPSCAGRDKWASMGWITRGWRGWDNLGDAEFSLEEAEKPEHIGFKKLDVFRTRLSKAEVFLQR